MLQAKAGVKPWELGYRYVALMIAVAYEPTSIKGKIWWTMCTNRVPPHYIVASTNLAVLLHTTCAHFIRVYHLKPHHLLVFQWDMACTHCLSEPSLLFAKMSRAHETNNEQIPFPEMSTTCWWRHEAVRVRIGEEHQRLHCGSQRVLVTNG